MNLKKFILGTSFLLILTSCGKKQEQNQVSVSQEYPTQTVHKQNVVLDTEYPVTIKGQEDIEIKPRIDGFIDAIYVDEGSVVKKNQVLFKINSPQAEQALLSAQALVNSTTASKNTAQLNVNRIRPLVEKGIISPVQLETYEQAYQQAVASLNQAQASLMSAQATIGWTQVKSPVDGVIGEIPYRQGSLVDNSKILTTVANIGNIYAYFSINEKTLMAFLHQLEGKTQAEKIKNIPPVTLILSDNTIYPEKGKVETITGTVNVTTGTANMRALFPNSHGLLRSGTSGKILIPNEMDSIFLIPQKATFSQQDKILVYRLQGDSVVQKAITAIPYSDGIHYVVTEGLSDGDVIVSDGIATLTNGKKISIQK